MTSPAAYLLIAPIRFYQRYITPYTPASCRHYPTCSAYAVTALRVHGAVIGTVLTVWRVLRCNPWSKGGIDYVPAKGWWRHRDDEQRPDIRRDNERPTELRERDELAASSSIVSSAGNRCANTDLDAPHSAAPETMIGRSAA